MANQNHLDTLKQGVGIWNRWRQEHWGMRIDLSSADLCYTDLSNAKLRYADLSNATLTDACLSNADLRSCSLIGANLIDASLDGVDLRNAYLGVVNLSGADLHHADLRGASLQRSMLVRTSLEYADMTGAAIYGISAWSLRLENTIQSNLVITDTDAGEPTITVDNLEAAQFIHLLLNNPKIRDIIDSITGKIVLILGRFTSDRKMVLDAIRDALRHHDYLPVVFDFEKPISKDLTETVSTLAHLSKFILLDLTDPSSAPHEAATIIPHCVVPVQPLLIQDTTRYEYAMFRDLQQRYHWVLPTYHYRNTEDLLRSLQERVIEPAEQKAKELVKRKQNM